MLINVGFCLHPATHAVGMKYAENKKTIRQVRYTSYANQQKKLVTIIFSDNSSIDVSRTKLIEITK